MQLLADLSRVNCSYDEDSDNAERRGQAPRASPVPYLSLRPPEPPSTGSLQAPPWARKEHGIAGLFRAEMFSLMHQSED